MKLAPLVPGEAITGIILAAGDGERMGGPKALLAVRWGEGPGELPLAIAHARSMLDGGAVRVALVTRAATARELSRFAQRGLDVIVSEADAALGPAGSLRVALDFLAARERSASAALSDPRSLYLVTPVDTPPSTHATRKALLDALGADTNAMAARPTFEGRRGHPVLIDPVGLDALRKGVATSLRDVLREMGPACADAPVSDRRVVIDLDTPADVESWYGAPARFFSSASA